MGLSLTVVLLSCPCNLRKLYNLSASNDVRKFNESLLIRRAGATAPSSSSSFMGGGGGSSSSTGGGMAGGTGATTGSTGAGSWESYFGDLARNLFPDLQLADPSESTAAGGSSGQTGRPASRASAASRGGGGGSPSSRPGSRSVKGSGGPADGGGARSWGWKKKGANKTDEMAAALRQAILQAEGGRKKNAVVENDDTGEEGS